MNWLKKTQFNFQLNLFILHQVDDSRLLKKVKLRLLRIFLTLSNFSNWAIKSNHNKNLNCEIALNSQIFSYLTKLSTLQVMAMFRASTSFLLRRVQSVPVALYHENVS